MDQSHPNRYVPPENQWLGLMYFLLKNPSLKRGTDVSVRGCECVCKQSSQTTLAVCAFFFKGPRLTTLQTTRTTLSFL